MQKRKPEKPQIPKGQLQQTTCPYCQSQKPFVFVHGHYQCADCKINIDPCCGGACPDF